MTISEKQYDLLNYLEQEWLINGMLPTRDYLVSKRVCTESLYDNAFKSGEFREALRERGISLSSLSGSEPGGSLSPEQLAVANVLLDRYDNRSRKKKLSDMGVNTQTLNGWMRDPAFRDYYTRRAENLFGDAMPDVVAAHVDQAERGDMKAIQLYYEMMGRYSPRQVNIDLNLDLIMVRVIEAIQKHVSNPKEIMAVAEELAQIPGNSNVPQLAHKPPVEVVDM
jgi:hypothetical protein